MNKLERYIVIAVVTAAVIFLIWFFSNVVVYILISAVLSLMGKPLVDLIEKVKVRKVQVPKWIAATVVLVLMWGVAIGVIYVFIPLIYERFFLASNFNFSDVTAVLERPFTELQTFLNSVLPAKFQMNTGTLTDELYDKLILMVQQSLKSLGSIIDAISSFVIAAFSISFITFFFLKENQLFKEGILILFPKKLEKGISSAIDTSIHLLSKYFLGLLLESTIKLIVIAAGLYLMGIDLPSALIIALISAVLNVIPYIGPLIGAGVGILIGIASPGAEGNVVGMVLNMSILFGGFQIIDNIILQPYIYSSSVKAHPLEIFLVILMAGSIAGVTGMLLAIPAYTVLRVFARVFFRNLRLVQKLTDNL